MNIVENINLSQYLTMRLGGQAKYLAKITSKDEILEAYNWAKSNKLKFFILGGGSNTLAKDEGFDGLIMHIAIKGMDIIEEDEQQVTLKVGAGEILDDFIKKTVSMNLSGIEAMSLIPGTVGAAPVQNVGAYGQEIADCFVSLEAFDTLTRSFVTLNKEECGFSYRYSIFRGEAWQRYIISSVTLRLRKGNPQPPFYAQVQTTLDEKGIYDYTPQIIRDTVKEIRKNKLPDPLFIASSGSFFKNAIISQEKYLELKTLYPELKGFSLPDSSYKISTGWLIDKAGLKGQQLFGMKVHDKNALVLINESAMSYDSLAQARRHIVERVQDKFDIIIQQEVLEI